ncbi:hypothetical protein AB0K52_22290 [Glycomyces sp. NPDC049804]|uniref:hypothetical protein n=1 Tax=Glycomyces sp. NPDC049804 TaxID=3154363 RepID=UPI003437036A
MSANRFFDSIAQVAAWNALHPVGTPIAYWPGFKTGDPCQGITIARASVLGGHTAVVWIDNASSCIALSHIEPLPTTRSQKNHA